MWVAGRGDVMEGMWVLNDLRYGCIDLWVCRAGRVIFRDSHFFLTFGYILRSLIRGIMNSSFFIDL